MNVNLFTQLTVSWEQFAPTLMVVTAAVVQMGTLVMEGGLAVVVMVSSLASTMVINDTI